MLHDEWNHVVQEVWQEKTNPSPFPLDDGFNSDKYLICVEEMSVLWVLGFFTKGLLNKRKWTDLKIQKKVAQMKEQRLRPRAQ